MINVFALAFGAGFFNGVLLWMREYVILEQIRRARESVPVDPGYP